MSASVPQLVIGAAQSIGLDPALALEVANAESGFNQSAVSSAGAVGVMQLLPSSFPGVDITDLETNITQGVLYLSELLNEFNGDVPSALAAYNWGPSNVQALQSQYGSGWLSQAPGSVQSYIATITGNMASEYSAYAPAAAQPSPAPAVATPAPSGSAALPTPTVASLVPTSLPSWGILVAAALGILILWSYGGE